MSGQTELLALLRDRAKRFDWNSCILGDWDTSVPVGLDIFMRSPRFKGVSTLARKGDRLSNLEQTLGTLLPSHRDDRLTSLATVFGVTPSPSSTDSVFQEGEQALSVPALVAYAALAVGAPVFGSHMWLPPILRLRRFLRRMLLEPATLRQTAVFMMGTRCLGDNAPGGEQKFTLDPKGIDPRIGICISFDDPKGAHRQEGCPALNLADLAFDPLSDDARARVFSRGKGKTCDGSDPWWFSQDFDRESIDDALIELNRLEAEGQLVLMRDEINSCQHYLKLREKVALRGEDFIHTSNCLGELQRILRFEQRVERREVGIPQDLTEKFSKAPPVPLLDELKESFLRSRPESSSSVPRVVPAPFIEQFIADRRKRRSVALAQSNPILRENAQIRESVRPVAPQEQAPIPPEKKAGVTPCQDHTCLPSGIDAVVHALIDENLEERKNRERRILRLVKATGYEGVGVSPWFAKHLARILEISKSDETVLITGSTGVGKEYAAKAIHEASRKGKPFKTKNCAEIRGDMARSELFGHEKGSFTGAVGERGGIFRAAGDGTVFLDEVNSLNSENQGLLLRALGVRMVSPVGSDMEVPFQARIIAATNEDLQSLIGDQRFRSDLLGRLEQLTLDIPDIDDPQRAADKLLLACHLLEMSNRQASTQLPISGAGLATVMAQAFERNIRQMEKALSDALRRANGKNLGEVDHECLGAGTVPVNEETCEALRGTADQYQQFLDKVVAVQRYSDFDHGEMDDADARILREYHRDPNATRIAQKVDLSATGVGNRLKEMGLQLPTTGRPPGS